MLYCYGQEGYEGHEVSWWRHFCRQSHGVLEIGANIGYYTVQGALAAPGIPYTTVVAHPESADVVRRNLELNAIHHVKVIQAAVVGTTDVTTVELALPDWRSSRHRPGPSSPTALREFRRAGPSRRRSRCQPFRPSPSFTTTSTS